MKIKTLLLFTFACLTIGTAYSQKDKKWDDRNQTGPNFNKNWSLGLGVNIVDDSGVNFYIGDDWNFSLPFTLSGEYYLNSKFSFNALLSMNKYTEGKRIDANFVVKDYEATYFAADLAAKFYLRDWFDTPVLDPYIFVGGGYTSIGEYRVSPGSGRPPYNPENEDVDENGNLMVPQIGRFTFNTGLGMNIWINNHWGVTGAATGKWGFASGDYDRGSNSVSNQIQFTMGLIYMFKE